jgi:ABC-type multidrug transport system ATPase subunit
MLNWRLTGRQNLEFYARLWGVRPSALKIDVDRAASLIGPLDVLEGATGDRSTGQRRRMMLAVAFLSGAPVMLLDEPFADLDAEGRRLVAAAMRGLAESGTVIMLATPNIDDYPTTDRSFALEDGVMRVVS